MGLQIAVQWDWVSVIAAQTLNLGGAASLLASGNAYSMQGKVEVPGDTSDCMLTELPFAVQFGADRRQLGRVCHGQSHLYPYTRDSR